MELFFSGGLQEMCMFHEPKGFWPTIFLHIFSGPLKSHCPVSSRALASIASSIPPLENTPIAEMRRFAANHCQSLKEMHVFEAPSG